MVANRIVGTARAAVCALALVALVLPAHAQQPSANAIALAKEIIVAKGAATMYDPVVANLIERTKGALLQTNIMLSRELNEVAAKLRTELAPRSAELVNDAARLYAARFTEQELRNTLAFYKSPLGQKVIADESKWVPVLGRFPLPVEVVPFGLAATRRAVEAASAVAGSPGPALLRRGKDGHAFVTDGGHWILDAALERIPDPAALALQLSAIAGVVEHGLFIALAQTAVLAGRDGVRVVERR